MATAVAAAQTAAKQNPDEILIEGVPFRKPTDNNNPFKLRSISPNVHLVFGHNLYCGKTLIDSQIKNYKAAMAAYEKSLKQYPNSYAYKPSMAVYTSEEFYRDALEKLLKPLKGLIIATVASFPEQKRGGQLYKKLGFQIAGNRCSWNPNYDSPKSPWSHHWLHLFYKDLDDSELAGKPKANPDYETATLNCCGAYMFTNVDPQEKPQNKLRLAFYDSEHVPEKRFIPIRQFKDYLVGVYPTTHKSRECPHNFDDPDEVVE
jgi:tetratricopeptide (TPR) repeat protein